MTHPIPKSVCDERHNHIDERCEGRKEQIDTLFEKVNCIIEGQQKTQRYLIGVLIALILDIVRGFIVLDNVTKMVGK